MHDFRSFVNLLREQGDLVQIDKPVDREFELSALIAQLEQAGRPFLFTNIKDAAMPLVGGLYLDTDQFRLALGLANDKPLTTREHAALVNAAKDKPLPPRQVESGPAKEVVTTGGEIDLAQLPVPTFFERDSGAFITGAVGISRHVGTGELNIGIYRVQLLKDNRIAINANSMSDLRNIYAAAQSRGEAMPIALAIGVDPALLMAAAAKPPQQVSEYAVAGALKGEAIEVTTCETSDLLVPANAEIVIEGQVDFTTEPVYNTLAEFPGLYGSEFAPVTVVTALTHRRDAMFYSIMAGYSLEHATLGAIALYGMRDAMAAEIHKLSAHVQRVHVVRQPPLTGAMMHIVIALDKHDDAEPEQLIRSAFNAQIGSTPLSTFVRRIVVVDDDIDVDDLIEVEWAIWTRVGRAARFILIPDVVSWELDRAADESMKAVRVGIDATMALDAVDDLVRPRIPGAEGISLDDYLP